MKKIVIILATLFLSLPLNAEIKFGASSSPASIPSGLLGATGGSLAAVGNIGEVITASVAPASAVSLTTATAKTVTSISLTAGNWLVFGSCVSGSATTTTVVTYMACSINQTNNAIDSTDAGGYTSLLFPTAATNGVLDPAIGNVQLPATLKVYSLSGTTTTYLTTQATFGSGTMSMGGVIKAIRLP